MASPGPSLLLCGEMTPCRLLCFRIYRNGIRLLSHYIYYIYVPSYIRRMLVVFFQAPHKTTHSVHTKAETLGTNICATAVSPNMYEVVRACLPRNFPLDLDDGLHTKSASFLLRAVTSQRWGQGGGARRTKNEGMHREQALIFPALLGGSTHPLLFQVFSKT